jgi:hypothetical protein
LASLTPVYREHVICVDPNAVYSAAEAERRMKLQDILLTAMANKMDWWGAAESSGSAIERCGAGANDWTSAAATSLPYITSSAM